VLLLLAGVIGCAGIVHNGARAAVFQLPTNGDSVIGQFQHVRLSSADTFADIARQYDVGYNELVAANPDVDPWLPRDGTQIVIPTQFVLPNVPWKGIVVNIAEMRLYYFPASQNNGFSLVYTFPIGIGRDNWETPLGDFKVVEKMENPIWTVPQSVLDEAKREGRVMPAIVPPGPDNPLGAHALMLSVPGYFIHGTDKPFTIGRRVSHGCLRLYPEDIEQLVRRVPRGIPVKIINTPVKAGHKDKVLYVEVHPLLKKLKNPQSKLRTETKMTVKKYVGHKLNHQTWKRIFRVSARLSGIPVPVADLNSRPGNTQWKGSAAFGGTL
jgi:L,D-transpeptidase ErfK/SrfK